MKSCTSSSISGLPLKLIIVDVVQNVVNVIVILPTATKTKLWQMDKMELNLCCKLFLKQSVVTSIIAFSSLTSDKILRTCAFE